MACLVDRWAGGRSVEELGDREIEEFAAALTAELDADDPICEVVWRHLERLREQRDWRPYR